MDIKRKKALLSLALAFIMPLSSCGMQNNPTKDELKPIKFEVGASREFIADDDLQIKENHHQALEAFRSYLDSIYIDYPFIDHYLSEEEVDSLINSANVPTACLRSYNLDARELGINIKNNTINFLKKNPSYQMPFAVYSNDALYQAFEEALYSALDSFLHTDGDLNEDLHCMEGLSIVFGDGDECKVDGLDEDKVYDYEAVVLGFYDDTRNLIVIDIDNIQKVVSSTEVSYREVLLSTIMHELNHVRQKVCSCRLEQNSELRSSFKYDDESSSLLTESSSESELYNLNRLKPLSEDFTFTYASERNHEAMILLMALCNENASIEDYYQAIFDTDNQALYNFLGLASREDIKKFYKIIYSMDAISFRNDLAFKVYNEDERNTKSLAEFKSELGYDYLVELYRIVLDRLSTYTYNNPDFTLEDNLLLLSVVEDIICDPYFTIGDKTSETYQRFMNNLTNMEHAYKSFLSEFYDEEMTEITLMDTDTYTYEVSLAGKVNDKAYYHSYGKKIDKLIKRFPILKAIIRDRGYFEGNYELVFGTNDTLTLKKEDF